MGRHGRFDSKIFESAHHFRIESNWAAYSESNRISKLRRSLIFTRNSVAIARICYGNSVCPSVCLSVCHTGGSVKNG